LNLVLGVLEGTEHAIAMSGELAAKRPDELFECISGHTVET
jgi:hypothetical protein